MDFELKKLMAHAKGSQHELGRKVVAFLVWIPTDRVLAFATHLQRSCRLPVKAATDSLHVAVAAVNGVEFLLTWNCTHLANAKFIPKIREKFEATGYSCPTICTPEPLMGI